MAPAIHDTIVLCRPHQVREAAVVLSCFPNDRFTPLIVLEPPPVSVDEYRKLYEEYRVVRNQRDAVIGGELGRIEVISGKSSLVSNQEEVDRKAELLTPYRSWWRHNRLIADLLSKLPLRRAIFLFEPQPQELHLINPIPLNQILDERYPTIPETIDWIYVVPAFEACAAGADPSRHIYRSLSDLTDVAWRLCGQAGTTPANPIEIPENDVALYFAGLFCALQLGVPLRPTGRRGQSLEAACAEANATVTSPSEAVLIEVSDDASRLLGILYAHHRQAELVLYPEPDSKSVEVARADMEHRQEQAAKSIRYLAHHRDRGLSLPGLNDEEKSRLKALPEADSPAGDVSHFEQTKFLSALRQSLFPDWSAAAIRRIEEAVSALVPDYVLAEVADLSLTAFTSGVPYTFVKKNGMDWSTKPIGHIVGDASLLILTELCRTNPDDGVGFNLIFDPGYFQTSETRDVLNELQKRVSYTLVLSGEAGSHMALIHLSRTLPLEIVFFNTHGAQKAMHLADMELPSYKLEQRVPLQSRPIVFNNSCLSWIGVGREFIRAGACAYIGTLWSVDANMAAEYARKVLNRMIHDNLPISRAMRNTGVDAKTERAYIFIGTCNTRLEKSQLGDSDIERRRVSSAIRFLLLSALELFRQTNGHSNLLFLTSLEDLLLAEAEFLTDLLDGRWPDPHLDRLDLLILTLKALAVLTHRRRGDVEKVIRIIDQAGRLLLDALPLDAKTRFERRAQLLHSLGRVYLRLGQAKRAVDLLPDSIRAAEHAGDSPGPQYLELSDAFKILGQLPKALDAAEKAKRAFETDPGDRSLKPGRMQAVGRLAQISNRLGQHEAGLRYAREGFELAKEFDNLQEQAIFKTDEARAYMYMDEPEYDCALEAANDSLKFARLAHNDAIELSAYGMITRALIAKGDLRSALDHANTGLAQARNRGFVSEIGDFLCDIAKIKGLADDHWGAFKSLLEAAPMFVSAGQMARVRDTLASASNFCGRLNSWEALSEMVKLEVSVIDGVEWSLRRQITMTVVTRLKDGISRTGFTAVRERLQRLMHDVAGAVNERRDQRSEQLLFIVSVLKMFDDWASRDKHSALQVAETLDQMSAGGFQLVEFLNSCGR